MKTILFLDRSPLTKLYSLMSKYLSDIKVLHVAYSTADAKYLSDIGVKVDFVYLDMFKKYFDNNPVDSRLIDQIDKDIITQTNGRFCLNSSIQSDRGFTLLNYEECLRSVQAHYLAWGEIFTTYHVDLMTHEPCSLFFNHLGAILCKKQGGVYTYCIAAATDNSEYGFIYGNHNDYSFDEIKYNFKKYLESPDLIDRERCKRFLNKFREENKVFMGGLLNRQVSFLSLLKKAFISSVLCRKNNKSADRIYNNVLYWQRSNNTSYKKIINKFAYRLYNIKFEDTLPDGEKFLFYPMHLEPEAVVLYHGDGIYKNQIKLIENIAASLPPGYFLYVKDHPHEYAYRCADDYNRLMKIPNLRLLNQWMPGKSIIQKCEGVITINGSAGFEALLLGKQVYCFGFNQYSFVPRVINVRNIRDFREQIYSNINVKYNDDLSLYAYVMAYLKSCHSGYLDCYSGGSYPPGFNEIENAKILAKDIEKYSLDIDVFATESLHDK